MADSDREMLFGRQGLPKQSEALEAKTASGVEAEPGEDDSAAAKTMTGRRSQNTHRG